MDMESRFAGCLYGLAIGDAMGLATEFVPSVSQIRQRFGPQGVTGFQRLGKHPAGTFTDDTQMSIAVANALIRSGNEDLDTLMGAMAEEFLAWSTSPENDRAPGSTCLEGCHRLSLGKPWRESGVKESKGCGSAMRVAPVGLWHHGDEEALIEVAAASSAITHVHPTALSAAVAAAAAVAWAVRGGEPDGLLAHAEACVRRLSPGLMAELGASGDLIRSVGTEEMLAALAATRQALADHAALDDVCAVLGEAWIGEEAVACALWCALRRPDDYRFAVLSGANSSGDSDSIACIAGAISGALNGVEAIDPQWRRDVEQAELHGDLARRLFEVGGSRG